MSGRSRSGWLPRVRPARAGDTDPALHLMRGLAQEPAPMILIGSPGREAGNLREEATHGVGASGTCSSQLHPSQESSVHHAADFARPDMSCSLLKFKPKYQYTRHRGTEKGYGHDLADTCSFADLVGPLPSPVAGQRNSPCLCASVVVTTAALKRPQPARKQRRFHTGFGLALQ